MLCLIQYIVIFFQFQVPHFKFYQYSLSKLEPRDEELPLCLKEIFQSAKNDQPIFWPMFEPMLFDDLLFKSSSWVNYGIIYLNYFEIHKG